MDVVSDILRTIRLNANVYHNAQYCGNWLMQGKQVNNASFHFVSHGRCYLHLPEVEQVTELGQGDLLLFPRNQQHQISASQTVPQQSESSSFEDYQQGVLPDSTGLVCGLLELEHIHSNPLLDELPSVVIVRNQPEEHYWVMPLLQLINQELLDKSPGCEAAVDKLADMLFIQVIRCYLRHHQPATGLLAALQDDKLHKALRLIHAKPADKWTLDSLARAVGVSRSVFAQRFKVTIGATPMGYLTRWRMQQAYRWLHDEQLSVLDVSERSGYQSDSAFSKAFKKVFGFGPGAARRDLGVKSLGLVEQ